ncbi:D-alanine--D-alanine ligase A [bacterium BMS3Abin15]|nr:D-alanine--D-alanine ligase A [bacterium BMS3Abin15]HDZ84959.1 D-alanine--D-alanine ligase [Candidatus Moranbacteria bacterium]
MKRLKISLIFGGKSGEYEVSLISARSIYNALDKKKYNIKLIGIDKSGIWHLGNSKNFWISPENPEKIKLNLKTPKITAVNKKDKAYLIDLENGKNITDIDVFFPITHGTFGEDGCLQGFLELLDTAYVGSGVLGSSVGMDKDIMKRLFIEAGILTCKFQTLNKSNVGKKNINNIIKKLKFPIFVKPANLGSSVGISKAGDKKELNKAIKNAFQYDNKIILEECVNGREIECSVLGNERPIASVPGEIKLKRGFYSYGAKYIDEDTAVPVPRADLTRKEIKKIQDVAVKIFKTLGCEGMGRVDFFLTKNGKLYANEINTLPGFTSVSMYPKMFEESGIPYPKLLDKLIQLGMERKRRNDKLRRDFHL